MEKEKKIENAEQISMNIDGSDENEKPVEITEEAAVEVVSEPIEEADEILEHDAELPVEETEEACAEEIQPDEKKEDSIDFENEPPKVYRAYVPRFTDASEKYRLRGDAEIRQRLGIGPVAVEGSIHNPDEIKLDPTAEFEEDILGSDSKTPEAVAKEDSDESLSIFKFTDEDREKIDAEVESQREEIKKLLRPDPKPAPDSVPVEEGEEEVVEEAEEVVEVEEENDLPDPDNDELGVYDFAENDEEEDLPDGIEEVAVKETKRRFEREFTNPGQRDNIKDTFLDILMSIRIRTIATFVFSLALLVIELLSAVKVISFKLFEASTNYSLLGILDFLLGSCIFIMAMPEVIKSVKHLFKKKLTPDFLVVPAFVIFGLYTLTVALTGATYYPLFGVLFASVTLPIINASLYRTKADFIAFKMISQNEEKRVIDKKNTRELGAENIALDGVVDEYKSKIARTFRAGFISDFFKNSSGVTVSLEHIALVFGVPLGIGIVAGLVAYFLTWSVVTAMATLALTVMLGCPAFAILADKVSFFHTQRAALIYDSVAIGEDSYHNFSSVDVLAFDDTDIFGPDDVNLKRFMLYGERDNMEKVMRQMCALFAAVGGPLDYMFSNAIDNRVRHKSATNMVIEDDGICGEVAGHKIYAGSEEYMRRNGIAIPAAATAPETGISLDTIKIMYAAEDGEVYAKFYIRYSFSEEFTMMLPSLREAGITPLVYTRDPNVSNELLETLTTGSGSMRALKLYKPLKEETVFNRVSAGMITYGDKLDTASMILLSKKYEKASHHVRFAEICAMAVGVILSLSLSIIGFGRITVLAAALWQSVWCLVIRALSRIVFLNDAKKKEETE